MKIDLPCFVGDSVFADLRENQKRNPKTDDLRECYVKNIEFDTGFDGPMFTVVREELRGGAAKSGYTWNAGEYDFCRCFLSDFGHSIFTKDEYLSMLTKEANCEKRKKD